MTNQNGEKLAYGDAIRHAFVHLMENYPSVFAIGQGLWSPWYVGNTMLDLDKQFGRQRVIDTPVSEAACTGAAIGASLFGYRPIVVHPRMDFMLLAVDQVVNQAAKWSYMLGGQASPAVTIRSIVNRGGEQGAQHSQALHAWFAHIPGLRVVMPATAVDARDLLIAATLCNDPVLYIDDRWLYDWEEIVPELEPLPIESIRPRILKEGTDLTLVAASYSVRQCIEAAHVLSDAGVSAEVIDLRVVNPLDIDSTVNSVRKSGRLLVVDGGWSTCGLAGEVIARVAERLKPSEWRVSPKRVTLPDAPAPSSQSLELLYYPKTSSIVSVAMELMSK